MVKGRVLTPGEGRGPLLTLNHPISFWGGVDPVAGTIIDPRHPNFEASIAGTVLAIPGAIGSSSSSAIMLELLREGAAPAALLLAETDAILPLGVIVARELGHTGIPVLKVPIQDLDGFEQGDMLEVSLDGEVSLVSIENSAEICASREQS